MATANIFALLGDDALEPKAAAPAAVDVPVKKTGAKAPAKAAAVRPPPTAARDGKGGVKGGARGGVKSYEGSDDQTFDRGNPRGGKGKGGSRAPRRDGDDAERRPRREYDRHVSRTGHGRETAEKRGTHGKGNWGAEGETVEGKDTAAEPDTVVIEEEPEEPDNELTLAEFEAAQAEAKAAINKTTAAKGVDVAAFSKFTLKTRVDEEDAGLTVSTKKSKGKKLSSKERKATDNTLDSGFRVQDEDTASKGVSKGGKGGKGKGGGKGDYGGKGARGGKGSSMSAKIDDASAFPTLGGK